MRWVQQEWAGSTGVTSRIHLHSCARLQAALVTKGHQTADIYQQDTAGGTQPRHSRPVSPAPGCTISPSLLFLLSLGLIFVWRKVSLSKLWLSTKLCFCESNAILLHSDHGRLETGWERVTDNWIWILQHTDFYLPIFQKLLQTANQQTSLWAAFPFLWPMRCYIFATRTSVHPFLSFHYCRKPACFLIFHFHLDEPTQSSSQHVCNPLLWQLSTQPMKCNMASQIFHHNQRLMRSSFQWMV